MTAAEQDRELSIRQSAYGYWQQAGEPDGRDEEFWQQAVQNDEFWQQAVQNDELGKKPTTAEQRVTAPSKI